MYKRKCSNWLEVFLEHTEPISESPKSVLVYSALWALAAAVRRHVFIGKKYLGRYEIYPHLYVVFVGPQGVIRKSTSIGYAERMLDELNLPKAPSMFTVPALLAKLADKKRCPDGSMYLVISELSTLVGKAGIEVFDYLNRLYDGEKKIDVETIGRAYEFAENPCINMIAATTPDSMNSGVMTKSILGSGMASRTIFIYEDTIAEPKLFYDQVPNIDIIDGLRGDLVADLEHIANDIHGQFEIEPSARKFMDDWYRDLMTKPVSQVSKIAGHNSRLHILVFKLAMLYHLCYSDELVLTVDDFRAAMQLLAAIEDKMLAAFRAVGKNIYVADVMSITKYIQERKRVPRSQLLEEFQASAEPLKLDQLLHGLYEMRKISTAIDPVTAEIIYVSRI